MALTTAQGDSLSQTLRGDTVSVDTIQFQQILEQLKAVDEKTATLNQWVMFLATVVVVAALAFIAFRLLSKPKSADDSEDSDSSRNIMAFLVVIASMVTLVLLSIIVMGKTDDAQSIFNQVLPILATWVGTIIAFYFGKENFEAASRSVKDMVQTLNPKEKLETLLAKDVMIPFEKLKCDNLSANDKPADLKLTDIRQKIITNKIKRWPVFQEKVFKFILHRSTIEQFLSAKAIDEGKTAAEIGQLTVNDMQTSSSEWLKEIFQYGAGFIPEDASLYTAKTVLDEYVVRNDVFLTKSGQPGEEVLGWISNVDIAKHGKY